MTDAELRSLIEKTVDKSMRGGFAARRRDSDGMTAGEAVQRVSSLALDFLAGKTSSFKVEFDAIQRKTVASSAFGLVAMTEPDILIGVPGQRVRDAYDQVPIASGAASLRYTEVLSLGYSAGGVAEGVQKPESSFVTAARVAEARKIATWLPDVNREALQDVQELQSFLDDFLVAALLQAEDKALITGDGIAPNILGLANVPGKQTQAFVTDQVETVRKAVTKLQLEYYSPTALLMHPTNWEATELLKDLNGKYILIPSNATPRGAGGPSSLWAIAVIISKEVTLNKAYTFGTTRPRSSGRSRRSRWPTTG